MESPESRVRWRADALKGQIELVQQAVGAYLAGNTHRYDAEWLVESLADGVDSLMEEVHRAIRWQHECDEPGTH